MTDNQKRSEIHSAFTMYVSEYAVFVKNFSSKIARKSSIYKALLHFCVIITRASILLTIPVAFIYINLLALQICTVSICKTRRFIRVNLGFILIVI